MRQNKKNEQKNNTSLDQRQTDEWGNDQVTTRTDNPQEPTKGQFGNTEGHRQAQVSKYDLTVRSANVYLSKVYTFLYSPLKLAKVS